VKIILVEQTREYEAYLLRLWPVNGESTRTWRASLENAHSGEVVHFAAMNDLFEFIRDRTKADRNPEHRGTGT
jgi:hypothetical protein